MSGLNEKSRDPSMEDVLASIRKIIAEELDAAHHAAVEDIGPSDHNLPWAERQSNTQARKTAPVMPVQVIYTHDPVKHYEPGGADAEAHGLDLSGPEGALAGHAMEHGEAGAVKPAHSEALPSDFVLAESDHPETASAIPPIAQLPHDIFVSAADHSAADLAHQDDLAHQEIAIENQHASHDPHGINGIDHESALPNGSVHLAADPMVSALEAVRNEAQTPWSAAPLPFETLAFASDSAAPDSAAPLGEEAGTPFPSAALSDLVLSSSSDHGGVISAQASATADHAVSAHAVSTAAGLESLTSGAPLASLSHGSIDPAAEAEMSEFLESQKPQMNVKLDLSFLESKMGHAESAVSDPLAVPAAFSSPAVASSLETARPEASIFTAKPASHPLPPFIPSQEPSYTPLVSQRTTDALLSSLRQLTEATRPPPAPAPAPRQNPVYPRLDEYVADLLRPLLSQWLDENLERIVDQAVRDEIAKVTEKFRP